MEKITFEYEIEDPHDEERVNAHIKAIDLCLFIDEFDNHLRGKIKYEDLKDEEYAIYENLREVYHDMLADRGLHTNMLS